MPFLDVSWAAQPHSMPPARIWTDVKPLLRRSSAARTERPSVFHTVTIGRVR